MSELNRKIYVLRMDMSPTHAFMSNPAQKTGPSPRSKTQRVCVLIRDSASSIASNISIPSAFLLLELFNVTCSTPVCVLSRVTIGINTVYIKVRAGFKPALIYQGGGMHVVLRNHARKEFLIAVPRVGMYVVNDCHVCGFVGLHR